MTTEIQRILLPARLCPGCWK